MILSINSLNNMSGLNSIMVRLKSIHTVDADTGEKSQFYYSLIKAHQRNPQLVKEKIQEIIL